MYILFVGQISIKNLRTMRVFTSQMGFVTIAVADPANIADIMWTNGVSSALIEVEVGFWLYDEEEDDGDDDDRVMYSLLVE